MKKAPLRISAVSYINARPFVYGIKHSGFLKNYSLSLDIPSVCAEKLLKGNADIGLAPVAIIPELEKYFVFPGFCIGADGPVTSVMLYSDVPLKEIKRVWLDNQSRTSVLLVKILAGHFWKISPVWMEAQNGYEKKIKGTDAGVIIGDRNFLKRPKSRFAFDLSAEWKSFTGSPFVFGCWISLRPLNKKDSAAFKKALKFGIDRRHESVKKLPRGFNPGIIRKYLDDSIRYELGGAQKNAMKLFLKLGRMIE